MFVFAVIPFLFGHILATRVVREPWWQLRLPVAYGLGLTAFLLSINILVHFMSLRHSVFLTLVLLLGLATPLLRIRPIRCTRMDVAPFDASVIIVLAMTACFWSLFWQMKYSDDDFFPHAPIVAGFLRDIFPPRDPLYPDFILGGHYGRDLTVAGLSTLFSDNFFYLQYVITSLNQAAITLTVYFTSRRFCRSRRAALLSTVLAFLCVNDSGFLRGLLDAFANNNSFAYLFLFLNIYLYMTALVKRDIKSKAVSAVALGTYSIVYETHFGVLVFVFAVFPILLLLRRTRWRPRYIAVAVCILSAALAIAAVEGGTVTHITHRFLSPDHSPAAQTSAPVFDLLQTRAQLHFPKRPVGITAFDGAFYPVLSQRLVREAGHLVALLPIVVLVLLAGPAFWGLLFVLVAIFAILVPATFDFGAYNGESLRFLFLGGMASAMAFGIALGTGLDRVARDWRSQRWLTAVVFAIITLVWWQSTSRVIGDFANVARRGDDYYWNAHEWACHGEATKQLCDPLDAQVALDLRPFTKPGERIVTNTYVANMPHTFIAHSIISVFSGAFVDGHGIRVLRHGAYVMQTEFRAPLGYRAISFWNTGDLSVLERMSVQYLLIDPARLSPIVYERLTHSPHLELVARREDQLRGQVREAYRVTQLTPIRPDPLPADLSLVSAELPAQTVRAGFYEVPFVVRTNDPLFTGRIEIGYRAFYGGFLINEGDEVRHVLQMVRQGAGRWSGHFFLVGPFEEGEYELALYAVDQNRAVPLRPQTGRAARWTILASP